ncbi:MAG: sodium:calcium antiporter [Spirochaetota bacterium]
MSGILVVSGLVLLVGGAEALVRGAANFARHLGMSTLLVGLTIVAAGTSLPELSTSIVAAIRGERDIAVANVVGSNIFNVLGVLGVAALVAPGGVGAAREALEFDATFMIVVAVACFPVFLTGGRISRAEGAVFIGLYVAYTFVLISGAAIGPELYGLLLVALSAPILALTAVIVVRILVVRRFRR